MRHSSSGTAVQNRLMAVVVIASLLASLLSFTVSTPASAHHVSASDFFIFSKAVYGKAAETSCNSSQGNQASVSGSSNLVSGRIHSNADWSASGQNNQFFSAVTYGTHDEDCISAPGSNDYSPPPPNNGAPTEVDAAPAGVGAGGWPGTLAAGLNSNARQFGNDVTQVLGTGAVCNVGSLTTSSDYTINPVADNNKVICRGSGKVVLNTQNATMKVTIISHGLIEISGQGANLSPADAGHGILAWTDQDSNTEEFSFKISGSNFNIGPSIAFTPRSGQDVSGSNGSANCLQLIGQGQIKIQGSTNVFGNTSCGPVAPEPGEITITKRDGAGQALGGATFRITPDPLDADASLSVTDNVAPDDNATAGTIHLSAVEPGSYTVCETAAPAGYIIDDDCQTLTVASGQNASFGPWVNTLSAIAWTKLDDETEDELCCATFTLHGINGTVFGPLTVVDNGANDADDDPGELRVVGLKLGSYRITETVPPTGYLLDSPAFQDVTLDGHPATGSPHKPFKNEPMPVLTVMKTPDGATPSVGDAVTYRIKTTNNGPDTASNATLFDDLPEVAGGWTIVANSPAATGWTSCSVSDPSTGPHADKGQILECGPQSINEDSSRTVTVRATLQAADCGPLPNLATADATNTDPASDTGSMDPKCPQIRVEKSPDETEGQAGANDVTAGGAATFTITVINGGDGQANAVNTFDDLPGSGWSVVGGALTTLTNCAVSDPTSGEHAAKGEILTCGPDTIGAGASKKVTVTKTTLNPTDCGEIDNTASVTVANAAGDSDSGNIDVLCPQIRVEKTPDEGGQASANDVTAGDAATFTIAVFNDANGAANGVDTFDDLPGSGWTVVGADTTPDQLRRERPEHRAARGQGRDPDLRAGHHRCRRPQDGQGHEDHDQPDRLRLDRQHRVGHRLERTW